MKQITLNIPDNKYSFFLELVKNLGLEKVKDKSIDTNPDEIKEEKKHSNISSLRGKLRLSNEQHKDFQQHISDSRKEWERGI